MNTVETRRNVLITKKESGVAVVMLDCPGKLNSLGTPVMNELQEALRIVASDDSIKGLFFISGKPDNFVIGADLFEIRKINNEEQFLRLSTSGQATLNAVADLRKPVVVAINGPCLGGGLELAMSGHWRIATDVPTTQLGLPETRLGIVPGLGGTQRLPRLVGLKQALAMILSAEPISAAEALQYGLVDELVSPDDLMAAAERKVEELIANPAFIDERRKLLGVNAGTLEWPIKDVDAEKATKLFAMTERSVRIKTKGNYPAQTRVVEVMKTGLTEGMPAGLALEARTFAELANSEVAANLIALFFQTDFAKQSVASLAAKFNQDNTSQVGIVGGGVMGAAVASVSSNQGMHALVKVNPGRSADAAQRAGNDKVEIVEDYARLADCQLVIECVREELDVKKKVLQEIEAVVSPDCVIASNTSALPLTDLAGFISPENAERFIGLHFFNPVDRMPLVEIVSLKTTSRKAAARAADYVTRLGKIPLMVKNGPGFLINRLLGVYLLEAAKLVEEGVPINWVDESAIDFGMPMGPYELLDEVGMDLAFKVSDSLYKVLGERLRPAGILSYIPRLQLVGKKNGRGAYLYDDAGRRKELNPDVLSIENVKQASEKADEATRQRIVLQLLCPMIDEAARCLEDKIVMKPREIDMAVVYGLGFPPFRGGLLKYADRVGLPTVVSYLEEADGRRASGKRGVAPLIAKYIADGRGFYSRGGKEED